MRSGWKEAKVVKKKKCKPPQVTTISILVWSRFPRDNASRLRATDRIETLRVNLHDRVKLTGSTATRRYYLADRFIGLTITR